MSARVLIVKNCLREGPGLLRDVLQEHHVGADVVELERGDQIPSLDGYAALFVLGGPPSANDTTPSMTQQLVRVEQALVQGLPFLGIGLGLQVLSKAAGGNVVSAPEKEIGFFDSNGVHYVNDLTQLGRDDSIFDGVADRFRVFQLHGEAVELANDMQLLATGPGCPNQVVKVGRRAYGFQAHVELVPEMLSVWCAQDSMLAELSPSELQSELASISDQYIRTSKRIFTNFLALADLIPVIDVTIPTYEVPNVS